MIFDRCTLQILSDEWSVSKFSVCQAYIHDKNFTLRHKNVFMKEFKVALYHSFNPSTCSLIQIWPIFRFLPRSNETHSTHQQRTLQLNSQHGLKAIWSDKFIWKRGNHITQGDKIGGVHFPFLHFDWNDANMYTYKCQIKFSY